MGRTTKNDVYKDINIALEVLKEIRGDSRKPGKINKAINRLEDAKFKIKLRG